MQTATKLLFPILTEKSFYYIYCIYFSCAAFFLNQENLSIPMEILKK